MHQPTPTWDFNRPSDIERYAVQKALDFYARQNAWVTSAERRMRFGADLIVKMDGSTPYHVEVKGTTRGLPALRGCLQPSQVEAAKRHLDDGLWKLFAVYEIEGRTHRFVELDARQALDLHGFGAVSVTESEDPEPLEQAGAAFLLTWNPLKYVWDGYNDWVAATETAPRELSWSTGSRKRGISPGDNLFLLRQGPEPRGLIGQAVATSEVDQRPHFTDPTRTANYVDVEFVTLLAEEDILPLAELEDRFPKVNWTPMGSGITLGESSEAVAAHFEAHVVNVARLHRA